MATASSFMASDNFTIFGKLHFTNITSIRFQFLSTRYSYKHVFEELKAFYIVKVYDTSQRSPTKELGRLTYSFDAEGPVLNKYNSTRRIHANLTQASPPSQD